MKKRYNLLLSLLFLPALLLANGIDVGKYSKQKTIKKAYIVNADAGIDIKNSYGNVTVTTWDEDKIELDILIKVSGDSEEWVDKRLADIDVEIEALKSMVTAITKISKSGGGGRNNSMEINYTIKIPKNGGVKIANSYGSIITGDLNGNATLNCQYGKIELGKLNGNANNIRIDYCSKSTIESVKNANIDADYSGLTLNDFNKVVLKADYTNINFGKGDELKYNCSYGKLTLGQIGSVDGNGDYLSINIAGVSDRLSINTKYGKITVDELAAKFNNVNINSGYTTVNLGYDSASAFDFDVVTKYSNFSYPQEVEMTSKQQTTSTKTYQGYYKKSGDNKIVVRSEYGNVNLSKK